MESRFNTVVAVENLEVATNDTPSVVVKRTGPKTRGTPNLSASTERGSMFLSLPLPTTCRQVQDVYVVLIIDLIFRTRRFEWLLRRERSRLVEDPRRSLHLVPLRYVSHILLGVDNMMLT